jgi:hypothetical protein
MGDKTLSIIMLFRKNMKYWTCNSINNLRFPSKAQVECKEQ